MSISITAIICARNESAYLRNLLPYLASENINAIIIDNESTDDSLELLRSGAFTNVEGVLTLKYNGYFDLAACLAAKREQAEISKSDWIIHQDADEILHSPTAWGGLRASIEAAHQGGFNVLNFNEMVMLPFDPADSDYMRNNRLYYFFEPHKMRLMRAWRRDAKLSNVSSAGHVLAGENIIVSPQKMILKHFIVRSQQHAIEKYCGRIFSKENVAKGWHGKRIGITEDMLKIPVQSSRLHVLETPQHMPPALPSPEKENFWRWNLENS